MRSSFSNPLKFISKSGVSGVNRMLIRPEKPVKMRRLRAPTQIARVMPLRLVLK